MKATRTFKSPLLQIATHRALPVRFRFHLPRLNGQRQPSRPDPDAGITLEAGHERYCGEGYYKVAAHEQELEELIGLKTVVLMTTPNR